MTAPVLRHLPAALAVLASSAVLLPTSASAHSLDSSTISVHQDSGSLDATVSVPLETLDEALGTDHASSADVEAYSEAVVAYLGAHLEVTGVDVALDAAGGDTSTFTLAYDAVIESDAGHEAVVVLTDAAGDISTPGVLTSGDTSLRIGEAAATSGAGAVDMVGHGFHHVLEGADHLLFLLTLLLVAPLAVAGGRWRRRAGIAGTATEVLRVVTSFTVGHSLTLAACALGWIALPSRLVEVLIAVSVAVAAAHALRPLARRGEALIAGAFGLVHGLAFAGILAGLGLEGTTSVVTLLAFNAGVELAQLLTVALVFPSLYVASRTRHYGVVRSVLAASALVAATAWALDRLALLDNPLAPLEDALVAHPWWVVSGFAAVGVLTWVLEHRSRSAQDLHTSCPVPDHARS